MTATVDLWVSPQQVRDYMNFKDSTTTGRYADQTIGSNIRTAERNLQKWCSRQWQPETATKTFTTDGAAQMAIPDLRSATGVTHHTTSLTANEGYWLIPSKQDQSVFVAVQLRAFNSSGPKGYLAYSDWFDRNLDRDWARGYDSGFPNDLEIAGTWGWPADGMPEDVLHAVKVLAAWYTLRPDSVLAGARQTPEGLVYDYTNLPTEVQDCITNWRGGSQLVAVGG